MNKCVDTNNNKQDQKCLPTLNRDIIEADPVAFPGHEHGLQRLVLRPGLNLCQVATMVPTKLKINVNVLTFTSI